MVPRGSLPSSDSREKRHPPDKGQIPRFWDEFLGDVLDSIDLTEVVDRHDARVAQASAGFRLAPETIERVGGHRA